MKKCIVILSGWGVDKLVWRPIQELLENDFEIFIVEWNDVSSLEDFKYKVINLLREKGIEKFLLMGWSLGSLVCLDIYKSQSSKIEDLILFSPTSKFVQDNLSNYNIGWHRKIVKRMILMLESYPEKTLESFLKNLFTDNEVKDGYLNKYIKELSLSNRGYSIAALTLGLEYLIHKDLRRNIKHIDIPVLIISGANDMICPIEAGKYISNNLKKSKAVILKETGHMPFYTKTNQCYELIRKFISNKEG